MRLAWWVEPAIAFGIALVTTLLLRQLILRSISRRAHGPKSYPAMFVATVRLPSILWALAAALALAMRYVDLPKRYAGMPAEWIGGFVIASLTLVAMSIAVRALSEYGERQGMPFAAAGLSRALIRVLVVALGGTALLANFGVQITPLLTALGVGGIAVALALQDTLANLFAGIHILVERPIFVGDFIKLEGGQEGVVTDIGWRTTRVRTGGFDMIVVPNTKITSGILVNHSLPDRRTLAEVAVAVSLRADPEQVRRIALEEAAAAEGVSKDFAPVFLCDPGVLPTHLQFKVIVQVADRLTQARVQSEIRMRLLARFRDEGVPLPDLDTVHAYRG